MSTPLIYKQLQAIQRELLSEGIGKDNTNKAQNYKYRSIEDVINALSPMLVRHNVLITPNTKSIQTGQYTTGNGAVMQRSVVHIDYECICTEDGSKHIISMTAEGADVNDKATNKANSFAYKYALSQALCIPFKGVGDDDGDNGNGYGNDEPAQQAPSPERKKQATEQSRMAPATKQEPAQQKAASPVNDKADEYKRIQSWANTLMTKHGVLDHTKVDPGKFSDEWQDILESPTIGKSILGLPQTNFKPKFCTMEEAMSCAWMTVHWSWLLCRVASEAGNDDGLDKLEAYCKTCKLLTTRTISKMGEIIKAARLPNVQ